MQIDSSLVAQTIAAIEAMDLPDHNGIGASTLRIVVDALGGAIKQEHPRFHTGEFQIACLPLQNERQKNAILRALEV